MKFGGSSVADAARMREVAQIVLSFPEEMPVLVLSAMGKTTNNLLAAGEMAMTRGGGRRDAGTAARDTNAARGHDGGAGHGCGDEG